MQLTEGPCGRAMRGIGGSSCFVIPGRLEEANPEPMNTGFAA
jgi:hypothetical protein